MNTVLYANTTGRKEKRTKAFSYMAIIKIMDNDHAMSSYIQSILNFPNWPPNVLLACLSWDSVEEHI